MWNEAQKKIIQTLSERTFTLRKIAAGDAEKLADFYERLSERSRHLFTPHPFDVERLEKECARFAPDAEHRGFILLDADDRVAAYFFLWHIDQKIPELGIGICDCYHGKGLGKLLIQFLIEEGRNLHCDRLRLTTEENNSNAFALYQKCGFVYTRTVKFTIETHGINSMQLEMFYDYQRDPA